MNIMHKVFFIIILVLTASGICAIDIVHWETTNYCRASVADFANPRSCSVKCSDDDNGITTLTITPQNNASCEVSSITGDLDNGSILFSEGLTRIEKNRKYEFKTTSRVYHLTVNIGTPATMNLTTVVRLDSLGVELNSEMCNAASCENDYGSISVTPADAVVGELLTFSATAGTGMQFDGFTRSGEADVLGKGWHTITVPVSFESNPSSFWLYKTMSDLTVTARFSHKPYKISAESFAFGAISVSSQSDVSGATAFYKDPVTVSAVSNKGYSCWIESVIGENNEVVYQAKGEYESSIQFAMPASDVSVKANCNNVDFGVSVNSNDVCTLNLNTFVAKTGEVVVVTPSCKNGHNAGLLLLECSDAEVVCPKVKKIGNAYHFTMPKSNVTVNVAYGSDLSEWTLSTENVNLNGVKTAISLSRNEEGPYSSSETSFYPMERVYVKSIVESAENRYQGVSISYQSGDNLKTFDVFGYTRMETVSEGVYAYYQEFDMPQGNATVYVKTASRDKFYAYDASTEHCALETSVLPLIAGAKAEVNVACGRGYRLKNISATTFSGEIVNVVPNLNTDNSYTFEMPNEDLSLNLTSSVYLAWNTPADSIRIDTLDFDVDDPGEIALGQQFYANGKIYSGSLNRRSRIAIGSHTLYPISGLSLDVIDGKLTGTIDGTSNTPVVIPVDIDVDSVVLKREFSLRFFSTLVLPFEIDPAKVDGAIVGVFLGLRQDEDGKWYLAVGRNVENPLHANVPYMVFPYMMHPYGPNSLEFRGSVTLNSMTTQEATYENWHFVPNYEVKTWEEGDPEIGYAYGIAGQTVDELGVHAGDFVRVAAGASIAPTRGYLLFRKDAQGVAPGKNFAASYSLPAADMPEVLKVKFEDEEDDAENVPMVIGTVDARTGEFKPANHRWFDMKGRLLDAKPVQKGVYYHNGKRVVIK